MAQQLKNLTVKEVSPVPQGANAKRFLLLKEHQTQDSLLQQVRTPQPAFMDRIKKLLKSLSGSAEQELSPQAQTALQATARILAPVKDEITDDHMDQLQAAVGIGEGSHKEPEGNDMAKPTEKQVTTAMEAAQKAFDAELEKLGAAKYPEGKLTMKRGKKATEDDDDDDEEDDDVGKNHEPIKVLKDDGTLNLDAAPAETRPFLEHISKAMTTANQRAEAAEKKCVDLAKELVDNKIAVRKSEIVTKAAILRNLPQESTVLMLELADAKGAEVFEKVFKGLEAQNAQIGAGALFSERGSGAHEALTGGGTPIMSKLEKAVGDIVQKAAADGKVITKEMAMADFLSTPSGQQMYAEEKNRRMNSHPTGA